ncbi:MAG: sulfotransferase [Casimicrobiaceae bacterium]
MIRHDIERLAAITADRRRHPEIAKVQIKAPIFITGLGRSGTTFLHSLLSRDPDNRAPLVWETQFPSPPPEAATYDTDPRIEQCARYFASGPVSPKDDVKNVEMQKKHLNGPQLTEEDNAMLSVSMRSVPMGSGVRILGYLHWLLQQDARPAYEIHKRWLQHLQWRNPRERWLLKAPTHIHNLPALFAVYPDARLIWCHRDPAAVISSMTSLLCTYRKSFMSVIDPPAIAMEMINYWTSGLHRGMAYRRANPNAPIFDIGHTEIVTDPIGAVRKIYGHFGVPVTGKAERALTAFVDENPREKLGAHSHGIERYGFTSERIHEIFGDYVKTFGKHF